MATEFPHLEMVATLSGRAKLAGRGKQDDRTLLNKRDRKAHAMTLRAAVERVASAFSANRAARPPTQPKLPASAPVLVKVDPYSDVDYLRTAFGFEVVSDNENGVVLAATEDTNLSEFRERLSGFEIGAHGGGSVAKVYELAGADNVTERLREILSPELWEQWPLVDSQNYVVDVSVACVGKTVIPDAPEEKPNQTEESWAERTRRWEAKRTAAYVAWDELKMEREGQLEKFVAEYGGEILNNIDGVKTGYFELPDSFSCRVVLPGNAVRDLAQNFAFVFEIASAPHVELPLHGALVGEAEQVEVEPPPDDAPPVCVIDSGIQEAHFLLAPAVDAANSRSFVPNDTDVADHVTPNGHGTRVAGAVLYPRGLVLPGPIRLATWIQNARVLDANNELPSGLYPPTLMRSVVAHFRHGPQRTRIFNHSINSTVPSRRTLMSAWAASIDELCHREDVLLLQSVGNVPASSNVVSRPGVVNHLAAGRPYPDYLLERSSRIADPAQALCSLSVGSVGHADFQADVRRSLAGVDRVSAFSRSGLGIWDTVKPEVVEYGGDYVVSNAHPAAVTWPPEVCPELPRSTFVVGPAWSKDEVGTSFAAPKVAAIASAIATELPSEPANLYRALIVQSARWPEWTNALSPDQYSNVLRWIGYGIPDVGRATQNSDYRVTLITHGQQKVRAREVVVFKVPIPEELRRPANESQILVEVTLAYTSQPRRTRRLVRNYFATWVDWRSSNIGESEASFMRRSLKDLDGAIEPGTRQFPWFLGERSNMGQTEGVRRAGALQKDWAIVPAHDLPSSFFLGVVGHHGWDPSPDSHANFALTVSFESLGQEVRIYEPIRVAIETQVRQTIEAQVRT